MLESIEARELLFLFVAMPLVGVIRGLLLAKGVRWVVLSAAQATGAGAILVIGLPWVHFWLSPWLDTYHPFRGELYVVCAGLGIVFAVDSALCGAITVRKGRRRGGRWRAYVMAVAINSVAYVSSLLLFADQIEIGWARVVAKDNPESVDVELKRNKLYAIRLDMCLRRSLVRDAPWRFVQEADPVSGISFEALRVLDCPTPTLVVGPLVISSFGEPCADYERVEIGEGEAPGMDVTETLSLYRPPILALCSSESLGKWGLPRGTGDDGTELHIRRAGVGRRSLGMRLPFVNRRWSDQEGSYQRWEIHSVTIINDRTLFLEIGRRIGVFYRIDTNAAWVVQDIVSGAVTRASQSGQTKME